MHSKVEVKKVGNGIQTHSLCTNFVWRTRLLTAICSLVGILRLLQLVNSYSTLFNEQLQASSRACAVFQTKANRIQKYTIACSTHNMLRREREREKYYSHLKTCAAHFNQRLWTAYTVIILVVHISHTLLSVSITDIDL